MLDWLWTQLSTIVAIAAILFFLPFELNWPRIKGNKAWKQRVPVIALMGLMSVASAVVLALYLQSTMVAVLKGVQVFSLAKSGLPSPVIFVLGFLITDFLTYAFHRLSHKIDLLWRLHSIHHTDEHVTAITGQLHHPFETTVGYLFMLTFYVVLGIPVVVVALYVLINSVHNTFSHADLALPGSVELLLRLIIVTPDMHRTHHSILPEEGNTNFGQVFSFWDRIFGTYADHPQAGERNLKMGLPESIRPKSFSLSKLLAYPLRGNGNVLFGKGRNKKGRLSGHPS